MNIKSFLIDFVSLFLLVFVVTSIVTYLWNLIFHDAGVVDWGTSFSMAVILGIILALLKARECKGQRQKS